MPHVPASPALPEPLDTLHRRFTGPVPRALRRGLDTDETALRHRQALARARALGRLAARARADVAFLRHHQGPAAAALPRCTARLAWARTEAEAWRRAAAGAA